jgi:nucleotide-binding universal stress UspA family protein
MSKVLVVANQTAESDELLDALRARAAEGDADFTLLVPSTPHGFKWAADMDAGEGKQEAKEHLNKLRDRLRNSGVSIEEAKIGAPDPLAAIQDECNFTSYDEIIVSTLPLHLSKWLKLDLPHKAEHATGLPVKHVEAK